MNPLLEQFLQEARENLAFIDQNIENIGGDDPELMNSVFRAAHTLKGGSGIVGFESVKNITHHAEDLLDMLRSGKIEFKPAMLEALYNAFDEVMNLIEAAEETEDIVDADEDTLAQIVEELNAQMNKEVEVTLWSVPFNVMQEQANVINLPMPFLRALPEKLPFELGAFDEAMCEQPHLYAVLFDVDESCMVYGNDPVYTLSLLGDKVLGIHTCMSETNAKSVLSGIDDADALLLKVQMTAFIYATYAEIEDSLFNFIDELQLLPLDVDTLLRIDEGESGHQLDVLKEVIPAAAAMLDSGDIKGITSVVEKALELIGPDTVQYAQLWRICDLLPAVSEEEYGRLKAFFAAVLEGRVYEGFEAAISEPLETAEANSEPAVEEAVAGEPAAAKEVTEAIRETAMRIFEQQYKALDVVNDEIGLKRIAMTIESVRFVYPAMPKQLETKAQMRAFLEESLGLTLSKEKPVGNAVTEPVKVSKPISTEAAVSDEEEKSGVIKPVSKESKEPAKKNVIGKTVKIEQEAIDNLMNIVGELLVAKNSLPYLAEGVSDMNAEMIKRAIMEKYTFINRLSEQLQDLIMSMRMLPISYVFDRYPKLVRDISKNLGKKVNLEMNGGETKLDKNMIEMLADPMIHIMRNSLDHGIEAPDIRIQKGKPGEGNVHLNAYAQSDKIIIEIKDDGAGINVDRVANKVLEKGLLTPEQIDAMNFDEKAELVLLPGLSTVDTISEYSGRGVGMDVVKKSIEGFGGTIRIRTVPNQGTTITLAIPVSLAVTSLLHVAMNSVHYGFPMDSVSETVKIDRKEIEYLHNEPFVYIRGEVIPLLFIKSMLNEEAVKETLSIVVLNIKGNLLAVVVNELLGQLDVVQKPLEGIMEHHPIFSGTALLGNGQIIMSIDPLGLLGIAPEIKSKIEQAS